MRLKTVTRANAETDAKADTHAKAETTDTCKRAECTSTFANTQPPLSRPGMLVEA